MGPRSKSYYLLGHTHTHTYTHALCSVPLLSLPQGEGRKIRSDQSRSEQVMWAISVLAPQSGLMPDRRQGWNMASLLVVFHFILPPSFCFCLFFFLLLLVFVFTSWLEESDLAGVDLVFSIGLVGWVQSSYLWLPSVLRFIWVICRVTCVCTVWLSPGDA